MSARLTVVLDDEDMYRRLKVKAAQDGVSMKDLVESGLRLVLGLPRAADSAVGAPKPFDWNRYEALLEEFRQEDDALGLDPTAFPTNLSDVKHQLYGYPPRDPAARRVAEERSEYDAE